MSINLTDELLAKTKKGKIASAKQVFLEGDKENLQQIGEKTHQLEDAIKDITVSGGASTATAVSYDNETSGMTAVTAQGAIDELAAKNKAQDAIIEGKAEKSEVATELDKKFDKENISQEFGDSENKVVSQSALPFRYIQNEEFIFAKVDANDKFLYGIQWDGTPVFGKTSAVEDRLQSQVNILADKITAILGDDDTTSAIDTLKELKNFFASIDNTQTLTSILANLNTTIDKVAIKDEAGEIQDTPFRVISNEEFLCAVVDSEDRVLYGIYRATGKPYYPMNEMYHVIQNEEFFAAWVTTDDKVVLGLRRDGEIIGEIHAVNALKETIKKIQEELQKEISSLRDEVGAIDANLKELIDIFSLQENPEHLAIETDADGKILSATNPDGSHYSRNLKSETIPEELSHIEDVERRMEVVTDNDERILSYRDAKGIKHEENLQVEQFYKDGNKVEYATKDDVDNKETDPYSIDISKLNGVVDYSLENLFDETKIRKYDSDFAEKVFKAIGRKTAETGCYSNYIPCKEGDWFTRNDFGTGIVVVLDKNSNILGDVKNVAYQPTFQIKASDGQDFSNAAYVVCVVMLTNLSVQKIVKAKYVPTKEEDSIKIPKLKIEQSNIELDVQTYIKGVSGRYYALSVDDSASEPVLKIKKIEGIPVAKLPVDFPKFTVTGDFSEYFNSLVMCPLSGGECYLFELGKNNMVARYAKAKLNCPRTITEDGTLYYYGINGVTNTSSGKLNIYKANGETFTLVKGDITDTDNELLEPHDCFILSVDPLHVITQRYVENAKTIVDGVEKTVTSLHVEEQYDGKRVWIWKSEDYPELWKDAQYKGDNVDYLHNNTICIDVDGNLILNNKHANQILVINRTWSDENKTGTIGDILFKIGGNRGAGYNYDVTTRIKTSDNEQWFESHDAEVSQDGLYTMFDNTKGSPSRILEFKIDKTQKVLTDFKAYTYKSYSGRYMGSVKKLKEGVYLVSWGSSRSNGTPNIGIYDFINKKVIFELKFEKTAYNVYRVYGLI